MAESSTFTKLKGQISKSDTVLDIGTKDADKMSDVVGNVVPIDLIKARFKRENSASFIPGDGRKLSFKNEKFDYVFCTQVLEHTPGTAELIAEAARVLKHDGTAYLSFPNRFSLQQSHSGIPGYYSVLPRKVGLFLFRFLLDTKSADYYSRGIHPLSPISARRHFHDNFNNVWFPMRLTPESLTDDTILQTAIWWLNTMAMYPPLNWIGELLWPHSQYVCQNPKKSI
jgi:SAM-dependent methyltransferase